MLFVAEELDEILEMSDRVVVLYEGRINAEFEEIDREAVGDGRSPGRDRSRPRRDEGEGVIEGRTLPAWRIERRAKPGGQVRYRVGSVAIGVVTAFALLVSASTKPVLRGPLEHPSASRPASSTCSP